MCGKGHRVSRITTLLALAAAIFAVGCVTAVWWPRFPWSALRVPVVFEPSVPLHANDTDELDAARARRDDLRKSLDRLLIEERELTGQCRLLKASYGIVSARQRDGFEESTRRLEHERRAYAKQLTDVEAQIERVRLLLERLDALILQFERDRNSQLADRPVLRDAAEILWKHDAARTGPNARIPNSDWQRGCSDQERKVQ